MLFCFYTSYSIVPYFLLEELPSKNLNWNTLKGCERCANSPCSLVCTLIEHLCFHFSLLRFEDAIAVSQRAAQLDTSSREVSAVARKAQAVASARSRGNDLFKASKFKEACMAYGEGLDHDPNNAILFCNRAACRSRLGQWEKAIEDCNAALIMRPSYSKARLRRADCSAKVSRFLPFFGTDQNTET